MKLILRVLFVLLLIMVLIIIAGLFLPKSIQIVTTKDTSASPSIVFEQLNRFDNWSNWSPWQKSDSLMITEIGNPSSGKGAILKWKSTVFGNCIATITHSVRPESIAVNFDYGTTNKSAALWYIEPTELGSRINWTINITKLSLFERYFALFYKNEMKKMIEKGLDDLTVACEESEISRVGDIEVVELTMQPSIILVDTLTATQLVISRDRMIDYVAGFFEKRQLVPSGKPFGIYMDKINDSTFVYACGLPIKERTWVWQTLQYFEIPATKAIAISHFGGGDATKAYKVLYKYIREKSIQTNGSAREVFHYNSKTDKDTSNWEIKVYMPIK